MPADASQGAAKEDASAGVPPVSPAGSREPVAVEANGSEAVIRIGARRYRVRGLDRAAGGGDALKVNLMAACGEDGASLGAFHVDTLDLYSARARAGFVEAAAAELDAPAAMLKAELGRVLLEIEGVLEARAAERNEPAPSPEAAMSEAERESALAFLRAPDPLDRIAADFEACGLVGEATNKLVAYLACVSRKLGKRKPIPTVDACVFKQSWRRRPPCSSRGEVR